MPSPTRKAPTRRPAPIRRSSTSADVRRADLSRQNRVARVGSVARSGGGELAFRHRIGLVEQMQGEAVADRPASAALFPAVDIAAAAAHPDDGAGLVLPAEAHRDIAFAGGPLARHR